MMRNYLGRGNLPETTAIKLQVRLLSVLLRSDGCRACGSFMVGFLLGLRLVRHVGLSISYEIGVLFQQEEHEALFIRYPAGAPPSVGKWEGIQ